MSKTNSSKPPKRSLALWVALAALALAGCNRPVDVNAPSVRGVGYVMLEDAVKVHPLYGQLSQLDDSIDALSLRSLGPAVPQSAAQIAAQSKALGAELQAAQKKTSQILQRKQLDYARRENAAIRAALVAAGINPGPAPAQSMRNVSAAQARAAASAAGRDFIAYQQSVTAAGNAAVAAIGKQITQRARREYQQKETQMQERESALALQLSQADAAQRLQLRTKLSNLALDDATRKQYQDRLAAIDARERQTLAEQRQIDQQALAAYQKQLQAQTQAAIGKEVAAVHARAQSQLAARRNAVNAQIAAQVQGLQPQPLPANLPAATRTQIEQIDKTFRAQFEADAKKTIADYQKTQNDLNAQYQALHGVDVGATGAAAAQMNDLRKRRDDLYAKIVEQIKTDAAQVAAKRGLRVVFVSPDAAAGGIDLTDDVEKEIESVHP